ncbi:hypothetical protein M011DRAFT_399859 [Sporormia fimetaria CBS 119925]|uniref:Translation initiation factor 3 N-terminal domain-containing protein n=1 Tax=Sporormia fimetaria CBS 119925 TaxID=1340428 RepID=A0A6A6VIA2_9PLEO|nr:hypothetical protein M011DRAFT_399859 [Sporormia fimetaria CBS 119925]
MPPFHLSSTSRALYRVFIAPALPLRTPTFYPNPQTLQLPSRTFTQTALRAKAFRKDTARHALQDHYTLDTAIQGSHINYVDLTGRFHKYIPLSDALTSFDRSTHHLLLVSAGRVDESGLTDPAHPPVCKVVSKIELRQQHGKKMDLQRRQAKGLGAGPAQKHLELNWAIAPGDLSHRLEKMKGFLREGRKVEVLLGPKRRGKVASERECEEVLRKLREAVAECKGSVEYKAPEGTVGGVMTLVYLGRRVEKEKEKVEKEA